MSQTVVLSLRSASDSRAVVEVTGLAPDAARGDGVTLTGPRCVYARTLPTTYVAAPRNEDDASAEILIPDPCYWTPELPFLYELTIGSDEPRRVGLRRLSPRGGSLYWEGKRVVLRGCRVGGVSNASVAEVRAAEVALIVPPPTASECATADEHGLPLVVDAREDASGGVELVWLGRHAAVAMILVDGAQRDDRERMGLSQSLLVAAVVHAGAAAPAPSWCDVVAVELTAGERPPAWLANCGKPVIAIRRGGAYADLHEARAACDRLQAELAPEFDLAGYFV